MPSWNWHNKDDLQYMDASVNGRCWKWAQNTNVCISIHMVVKTREIGRKYAICCRCCVFDIFSLFDWLVSVSIIHI